MTTPERCVICGGALRELAAPLSCGRPLAGERIAACTRCRSAQVTPMPSADALAALYTRDYYEGFAAGPGVAGGQEELRQYLKDRLATLTERFGRGRLLDLGCGVGLLVAHAASQGWDAIGVEPSSWAAEEGRRRFGIRIIDKPLEQAGFERGTFDVIHANHVLEHLTDPVGAMRTARDLLRPGGVLVAEVPQELTLPLAESVVGLLRGERLEPSGPFHVVFFSEGGLRLAVERAGLRLECLENRRHRDNLRPRSVPFRIRRTLFFALEAAIGRAPVYVVTAARPSQRP